MNEKIHTRHSSRNEKVKPDIQGNVESLVCLLKWELKNWVHFFLVVLCLPNSITALLKDWSIQFQIDFYGYFSTTPKLQKKETGLKFCSINLFSMLVLGRLGNCTQCSIECRASTDWEKTLHSWMPETCLTEVYVSISSLEFLRPFSYLPFQGSSWVKTLKFP